MRLILPPFSTLALEDKRAGAFQLAPSALRDRFRFPMFDLRDLEVVFDGLLLTGVDVPDASAVIFFLEGRILVVEVKKTVQIMSKSYFVFLGLIIVGITPRY